MFCHVESKKTENETENFVLIYSSLFLKCLNQPNDYKMFEDYSIEFVDQWSVN